MVVKAMSSITLTRIDDGDPGQNAITGYLTNESLILPASSIGIISSFSGANGYFRIMDGNAQAFSGFTFSLVSATGITTTINASGYFSVTAMSADVGTATYRAVYKGVTIEKIVMVVKNKQGDPGSTGPAGPATGVIEQSAEPALATRYVGMLWKDTDDGITRKWNGSAWGIFLFHAENISATTLSAITANLGTVTAGKISGSGTGGSLALDLATGTIVTSAVEVLGANTYATILEVVGGRISSTETNSGGTEYVSGVLDGAELRMGRYSASNVELESTVVTPRGFVNKAGVFGRTIEFTSEGMRLSPSLSNTGNAANSGIELVGKVSYIDFHNTVSPTEDFNARIVMGYPSYGMNKLVLQNGKDDVQIQTYGNLHVKNADGTGYKEVRAAAFSQQSAHSSKQDFEHIKASDLLDAVLNTDIVTYRMKYNPEAIHKTIGFVINDDGESPYNTSELLINDDNGSFNTTTAIGIIFGAIKSLNKKIEQLEAPL